MAPTASALGEPVAIDVASGGSPRTDRALRLLPALLVSLIALIQLALYAAAFAALSADETSSHDFSAAYVGALLLREGNAAHLYDATAQMHLLRQLEGHVPAEPLPFVYPPSAALLVVPLTALPVGAADRAWSLLQLGLVVTAAVVAARSAPWPRTGRRAQPHSAAPPSAIGMTAIAASVLIAVAGTGTAIMLLQGQPTGLLALSVALAYAAWARGHHGRAALALSVGFLAFKPHLAIGLVVYILALRNRRALIGLATGAGAVVGLSLAVAGPSGLVGFLALATGSSHLWPVQTMLGFTGLTSSQFGSGAVSGILAALLSLAAAAGCWLAGRRASANAGAVEVPLAAATLLSLLLAPHLLVHDLVVLCPVLVWCLAAAARADSGHPSRWPGAAAVGVLALWLALDGAAAGTQPAAMPRRLVPYLLILAVAWLAAAARQTAQRRPRRLAIEQLRPDSGG